MDTKKLRQKILDLAIRGKLVPQDPNDEPASILLERIRAEKERLIKEGKIKRSKKTATDDEIEAPFKIPESWEWTTISEIASSILYGVSESAKESGNYKLLRITDIQNNKVKWETVPFTNYDENKAQPYLLQDGDILFARTGATVGKSYLVEGLSQQSIYASYLIRVQTPSVMLPSYIKCFFESGYYWEQISLSSVGIGQPNVNGTTLAGLSIPIPPYQEQLRISNEVERWFAVIDELENNEGDLLKAIDQAKSKILDLAFHGKLVPQDGDWKKQKIKDAFIINPKNKGTDDIMAGFVPMSNIQDGYRDSFVCETRPWGTIKKGFTHFADGDIAVAKISPCLENRKSMVLANLPNGIGAGTTELIVFRCKENVIPKYGLYFFKTQFFIDSCVGTFNGVVGQQRVGKNIVEELSIPIPPIAVQQRIVANIEELFAVLDKIKNNLNNNDR